MQFAANESPREALHHLLGLAAKPSALLLGCYSKSVSHDALDYYIAFDLDIYCPCNSVNDVVLLFVILRIN